MVEGGDLAIHVRVSVFEFETSVNFTPIDESVAFGDHADFENSFLTFEPTGVLAPSAALTELRLDFQPLIFDAEVGVNRLLVPGKSKSYGRFIAGFKIP